MAHFKFLILAVLAAFFTPSVSAGYAQLSVPPGFAAGASGAMTYTKSAGNAATYNTNTVRTNASLNIGGQQISVPVGAAVAANAATLLAPLLFKNPWLAATAAIGTYFWLDNMWQKNVPGAEEMVPQYGMYFGAVIQWFDSPESACAADKGSYVGPYTPTGMEIYMSGSIMYCRFLLYDGYGNYQVDSTKPIIKSGVMMPTNVPTPVSEPEFNANVIPSVTKSDVLKTVPDGIPIPVDSPMVNPTSDNSSPSAQPYTVPVGDPVPVPNTNPQQWKNPVINVAPSPTLDQPWRVDIQPQDIIKTDPSPIIPNNPLTSNGTPQDKTPGLCDMYPDILACQKPVLDTPPADTIETKNAEISITPDSGWGADGAACPSPRHLSGANVDFDFTLICDFMTGIRPVIIAIAWMSAAMILIGFKRGE